MPVLSVRLDDAEQASLKATADRLGVTVSVLVKDWIASFGGGEVVPSSEVSVEDAPVRGSSAASPPPQVAVRSTSVQTQSTTPIQASFLAAPVDDCQLCGHDRQASSHLGGQKCQFRTSPRRICGCTFEGF